VTADEYDAEIQRLFEWCMRLKEEIDALRDAIVTLSGAI